MEVVENLRCPLQDLYEFIVNALIMRDSRKKSGLNRTSYHLFISSWHPTASPHVRSKRGKAKQHSRGIKGEIFPALFAEHRHLWTKEEDRRRQIKGSNALIERIVEFLELICLF